MSPKEKGPANTQGVGGKKIRANFFFVPLLLLALPHCLHWRNQWRHAKKNPFTLISAVVHVPMSYNVAK